MSVESSTALNPHAWEVETVPPPLGLDEGEFWKCANCGASGGAVWDKDKSPIHAFLAGPAIPLSIDCEIARIQIEFYRLGYERGSHYMKLSMEKLQKTLSEEELLARLIRDELEKIQIEGSFQFSSDLNTEAIASNIAVRLLSSRHTSYRSGRRLWDRLRDRLRK